MFVYPNVNEATIGLLVFAAVVLIVMVVGLWWER